MTTSSTSSSTLPILPIKFADVGKNTNDLLSKDFPIGIIKFEGKGADKVTSRAVSKFNVTASRDTTSGNVTGEVKNTLTCLVNRPAFGSRQNSAKLERPAFLLESTTTLGSSGSLIQQMEVKDAVLKGLNLSTTGTLTQTGAPQLKFSADYVKSLSPKLALYSTSSLDLFKGPFLIHDTSVKCGDLIVGGQMSYNTQKGKLDNYIAVFGYDLPSYKATIVGSNCFSTISTSFYQKFDSGVETGYKATWNRTTVPTPAGGANGSSFGSGMGKNAPNAFAIEVVSKFPLEPGSFLKTKLDNNGKLGISYTSIINSKVSMTLAGIFDTFKMEEGNHRVGVGLTVDV